MLNDELIKEFLEEATGHVETLESGLLKLEQGAGSAATIHDVFRAVHSIKGAAGFFNLNKIVKLSHAMENLFGEIREGNLAIDNTMIDILLTANDTLKRMVGDPSQSEHAEISGHVAQLAAALNGQVIDDPPPVSQEPVKIDRDVEIEPVTTSLEEKVIPEPIVPPDATVNPETVQPDLPSFTAGNTKVLTFYVGHRLLGVDITAVKEINRNIEYTPVPGGPPHIAGLLNMRGLVVTLFDLARIMGYQDETGTRRSTCIILKNKPNNPDYVGFLVDRRGSVVDVDESICEALPANVSVLENRFVDRVVKLSDELLMIVSYQTIFEQ